MAVEFSWAEEHPARAEIFELLEVGSPRAAHAGALLSDRTVLDPDGEPVDVRLAFGSEDDPDTAEIVAIRIGDKAFADITNIEDVFRVTEDDEGKPILQLIPQNPESEMGKAANYMRLIRDNKKAAIGGIAVAAAATAAAIRFHYKGDIKKFGGLKKYIMRDR